MKRIFLLLLLLTFFNIAAEAQKSDAKFKLVIDAGHGGTDPGCLGKKSYEKNINLSVAQKLGKLVSDNFDDVQVIYTRSTDVFVEVYKRAVIANNNHADLFISIHCNAVDNHAAHGVETFVMGLSKSEANMEVARRENASILKEKNFENNYEGFNPNSPEAYVIFSLQSSAYKSNSILLADKVQKNLVRNTKLYDRSVQQAAYWVLYKVAMPSILVELGFLSNPVEEEYMIKSTSQDIMAISIYNAFVDYRSAMDGVTKNKLPLPSSGVSPANANSEKSEMVLKNMTVQDQDPEVKADPVRKKTEQTENKPANPGQPAADNNSNISFRVQFVAVFENIPLNDSRFRNMKDVGKYFDGKYWKYTTGNVATLEEAKTILQSVNVKYPDAFIVAFEGDTKITVQQAQEKLKQK